MLGAERNGKRRENHAFVTPLWSLELHDNLGDSHNSELAIAGAISVGKAGWSSRAGILLSSAASAKLLPFVTVDDPNAIFLLMGMESSYCHYQFPQMLCHPLHQSQLMDLATKTPRSWYYDSCHDLVWSNLAQGSTKDAYRSKDSCMKAFMTCKHGGRILQFGMERSD